MKGNPANEKCSRRGLVSSVRALRIQISDLRIKILARTTASFLNFPKCSPTTSRPVSNEQAKGTYLSSICRALRPSASHHSHTSHPFICVPYHLWLVRSLPGQKVLGSVFFPEVSPLLSDQELLPQRIFSEFPFRC